MKLIPRIVSMIGASAQAIATLGLIFLAFVTNALSNVMPLNGQSVGEISNTVFQAVLITPANYAFAIWGLIYLGVFTFGFYQLSPAQRHNPDLNPLRSQMMIASGAQIAWIFVFLSRQYILSLIAMVAIWVALCLGYRQITTATSPSLKKVWLVQAPWSLYFGWISVATIVNVALTLFSLGWRGGSIPPQIWTSGLLVIAMILGMIMAWKHRDIAFSGVVIWALVAIAIRHQASPMLFGVGIGSAIALGLVSAYSGLRPQLSRGS